MFTPVKNTKVYEIVVEQIKNMIKEGTLKKGDKLPTEREMSEELQVSRASVREALRALEVVGLIESKQGAGNYIKTAFDEALFQPLSIMFMIENHNGDDIYEIREMLELETVKLATNRIDYKGLEELNRILDEMKNSEDEELNVKLDKSFHYTIAKASGNTIVINFLQVISQLIDEFIKDSRKNILLDKNNREKLLELHEEIYMAMRDNCPERAQLMMKAHFKLIRDYMK